MSWADEYLKAVAEQIRVKRIRQTLTDELRDHMELQKADFMEDELSEEEAGRRTIEEMGDALLVGGELDRVHRPAPQWKGILLALLLMLLGIFLRTVFTPDGQTKPVDFTQCAGVCVALGVILLLGLIDYMHWIRWAVPLTAAWSVLLLLKLLDGPNVVSYYLHPGVSLALMTRVTIEHISLAAPVLTGLMIGRKRGGGQAAFAAALSIPAMTFLLGLSHTWRGHTPQIVMLMALLCTALLMLAVRKGFFKIGRPGAYAFMSGLAAAILIVLVFFSARIDQSRHAYYLDGFVYPLLSEAKMLGSGRMNFELLVKSDELFGNDLLLPFIIYRFGWLPFAALTAAAIRILIWAGRKFARMENWIGSLLGTSCVLTLALQAALYYVHCYTVLSWPLGFPLISYGMVVLWIDAAMVGLVLSVLRGEKLPEGAEDRKRKVKGGVAA